MTESEGRKHLSNKKFYFENHQNKKSAHTNELIYFQHPS